MSFEILTEQKFAEVYQALWMKLYSAGYNHLRDASRTKELVQNVFVKLWLNRHEVRNVEDVELYLTNALQNQIYDHFECERGGLNDVTIQVEGDELISSRKTTQDVFSLNKYRKSTNEEIATTSRLFGKAFEYQITQAVRKLRLRLAIFLS